MTRTVAVFRNRAFLLLWLGQLISGMGSALTTLAASILVFRLTGSALSVGLMLIATAGPTIVVGLLAGVFVDRYDRRRIMLASDLLRGMLILLVPFLVPLGIGWLYVIVALTSAITQFFDSAHASVLPDLASDEDLAAANSLMAMSSVGSTTVGFALAGLLATTANLDVAFFGDAATFALSALLVGLVRLPSVQASTDSSIRAVGQNLKVGLRTIREISVLRSLFLILVPIFLLFGLQNTLLLPFALKALGATEFEFGLQQAAEAVGLAFGSLLMIRLGDRLREGEWLVLSYLLMGAASVVYAFSTTITLAIFLVGLSGFVNAPSFIARQLLIQRAAPRATRGRVNSAFFVLRDVMFVAGMAMAGLADVMSVRLLFLLSSLLLLAVGVAAAGLPGVGQPVAEWRRIFSRLRGVEAAPRLGTGVPATLDQINRFIAFRPELQAMKGAERQRLAAGTLVVELPEGKPVVYHGETHDAAFLILSGSVDVGVLKGDQYVHLNTLREGELFGEVAALTGRERTANVITHEPSTLLVIPGKVLRRLAAWSAELKDVLYATMAERLSVTDLPLGTALDQGLLKELRSPAQDIES
ncbi:MAG TPA: MFS transporter [Anaerolineales bacterium]|nr:MFS transporter [Anaerolineales bacterium]